MTDIDITKLDNSEALTFICVSDRERKARRQEIDNDPELLALEQELAEILGMDFKLDQFYFDTLKGINFYQMLMLFREGDGIKASQIIEIGSRAGCSSILLGALAKKHEGAVFCLDPKRHEFWQSNIKKHLLASHCLAVEAESPWWNPLPVPEIDLLFIDGNHDFIPCLVDFYYWNRYVRSGGLIAFHDTQIRDGVKEAMAVIESGGFGLEKIAESTIGTGCVMYRKN